MYQFFVRDENICGDEVRLTGDDAFHLINVVRVKRGEKLRISTDSEKNYMCEYECEENGEAVLRITEEDVKNTELPGRIHLFQGIPKKERFEYVIEKVTELGVSDIIPVRMRYCVAKIEKEKAAEKIKRLSLKAEAAAKQSKRSVVPKISLPLDFNEALEYAGKMDLIVVPYENAQGIQELKELMNAPDMLKGADIALFIGPEGGFSDDEIAALREKARIVSLGSRILRTDTAAIMGVGLLAVAMED